MSGLPDPKKIDVSKLRVDSGMAEFVTVPFEFKANDFLNFAEQDLRDGSLRSTVNALGNIKRCIDCLSDALLYVLNYLEKSKKERWTFPEKISFLGESGIIAPYVLSRINSMRNLLEHECRKPDRKEVETSFDIANLFYYATSRFTRRFPTDFELFDNDNFVLRIKLDRKHHRLEIETADTMKNGLNAIQISENQKNYKGWLKVFFQIQYLCM